MALPTSVIPRGEVVLSGGKALVRGLSRAEVHRLTGHQDDNAKAEAVLLAMACDMSEADAAAWLESASSADADLLVNKVLELSGLGDGQAKS